jgi:catechol 2,3-dioxygenase
MTMTSSLQLTAIRLRVPDLARSLDFYVRRVGLVLAEKIGSRQALLATAPGGPAVLTLEESPEAAPAPRDAAGLFHAALLFPRATALGGWLRLAASRGVEFDGFSDHGVSEALYFSDPDGNGLEFYADRPAAQWPRDGSAIAMGTRPLDVQRLIAEAAPADVAPLNGTAWGHLHLRVTDLERSERFYRETLGMEVTQRSYPGARFLAADGYHHHVAINTWGAPRHPQPAMALGLAEATFAHTGEAAPRTLRDPDGIALRLVPMRSTN